MKKHRKSPAKLTVQTLGKTMVRQNFLSMVDKVAEEHILLEITDRNVPVAVMVSYQQWIALLSKEQAESKSPDDLRGSIKIQGNLADSSSAISKLFIDSAKKSAYELTK